MYDEIVDEIDNSFGQLSNFADVVAFSRKFGLAAPEGPTLLDAETAEYRRRFLHEELDEYVLAYQSGDLAGAADALVDLVYVALGTAYLMGLPWQELWDEVQRANMAKRRAISADESKRGSKLDVVKPVGWTPPDIEGVLSRCRQRLNRGSLG